MATTDRHTGDPECTCSRSATDHCPTHGDLADHAASLRGRLDTDRESPERKALYAALEEFAETVGMGNRAESPVMPKQTGSESGERETGTPPPWTTHPSPGCTYSEAPSLPGQGPAAPPTHA